LRGLKSRYEVHHGVEISDAALVTGQTFLPFSLFHDVMVLTSSLAAVYSARYISDRYLPDKAIDLVDEAASSLRLAQESKPEELQALDRDIMTLQIELESLKNETDVFSVERRTKVEGDLLIKRQEADALTSLWQAGGYPAIPGRRNNTHPFLERTRLQNIKETKKKLEEAKHQLEVAQRQGQYELASRLRFATIPELERQLPTEKAEVEEESPLAMLHDRVTSNDIARVVAKATGIPVQNLLKGERDKLVHVRCLAYWPIHRLLKRRC
jgi:ATP-dependent Clp protease ATP-binding subunit ClpB